MGGMWHRKGNWTEHLDIGRKITETCYQTYNQSSTGLGSEGILVLNDGTFSFSSQSSLLRPEVIESIFYQYRFTNDPKYRAYASNILNSLDKLKDKAGYHSLEFSSPLNKMESFFFAETLKYLYLIYSEDSVVPLDQYVFNTEAHPLSIRGFGQRKDPTKWVPLHF